MVRLRKGKHKTWRKGQSCESNPATRKYRTAAKRGSITGRSTQNSNLTVEALAKHEERHDDDGDVELKEDEGFSVKSEVETKKSLQFLIGEFWTLVLLKVVYQFVCFVTPYLPTTLRQSTSLMTFAIWLFPWQT